MRSHHGFGRAILEALPEEPPGLPTRGIHEVLKVRMIRPPTLRCVRDHMREYRDEGVVEAAQPPYERGPRYWRPGFRRASELA